MITKIRTFGYLIITLVLALKLGLLLHWGIFFTWGFLMAAWEQPTHHWATSIFNKWKGKQTFWDATESWKYKLKIWGISFPWNDSFHISKSLSILAVSFLPLLDHSHDWMWYENIGFVLALGWLTTESFNASYNYILVTKNNTL
jgi:hypothetical protein